MLCLSLKVWAFNVRFEKVCLCIVGDVKFVESSGEQEECGLFEKLFPFDLQPTRRHHEEDCIFRGVFLMVIMLPKLIMTNQT